MDIATGRVYISRDIVFDETIFPFSTLNPIAGKRLHDELLLFPRNCHDEDMNSGVSNMPDTSPESCELSFIQVRPMVWLVCALWRSFHFQQALRILFAIWRCH